MILAFSVETSQNIWETENKKLKEQLTNLRSDLKEQDDYLKNKLIILEDRSRRNNIRVEGIPGSENEGWDVTEEKLKKVIKDELDENKIIQRKYRVKRNNDITKIMTKLRNLLQLLLSYYILKTNRISCMKQNCVKLEIFISKKISQEEL